MTIFFAVLLTLAGFAIIAYPLLKPKREMAEVEESGVLQELDSKKDTTYAMLKELEFDYHSGILSEEDYRELEERYKKKAVSLLKEADQTQQGIADVEDEIEQELKRLRRRKAPGVDDRIEREILRLRKHPSVNPEKDIEREVAALRQSRKKFCTQCGSGIEPDDRFCPQCGVSLDGGKSLD